MTDAPAGNGAAQPQQPIQPQIRMLAHYIRDLSFENVAAMETNPTDGKSEIQVAVNLEGNKTDDGRYKTAIKINATAKVGDATRFLIELDYGALFSIENAPAEHVHPILFIECPRLLLPFARRVIADITRDGGYPPVMLDNIDFATLYRQQLEQARAQQAQAAAGTVTT